MTRYLFTLLAIACTSGCSHNEPSSETAERTSANDSHLYGSNNTVVAEPALPSSDSPVLAQDSNSNVAMVPEHRTSDEIASNDDTIPARVGNPNTTTGVDTSRGALAPKAPMVTDGTHGPNNTHVNQRDRGGHTLTPTDQSEKEGDIKLTQDIRRALVDSEALSFSSKNVKIITRNGHVTLRGNVPNARERSLIEDAAKAKAGATRVDSQLEIVSK